MPLRTGWLKDYWAQIAQIGTLLGLSIGGLISFPPKLTMASNDDNQAAFFSQFLVTVAVGLMLVVFSRFNKRNQMFYWASTCGAFLVVTTILVFVYRYFQANWTCQYAVKYLLVIGDKFTPDATNFLSQVSHQPFSCAELLAEYAGDSFKIWERDTTIQRHLGLAALHSSVWAMAALTIMALLQALRCSVQKKS